VVVCLERGANCLHLVQLAFPEPHHFLPYLSRLVLPFWYRLTQIVLEKRPLNGCSSSSSSMECLKIPDLTSLKYLPSRTI